MKREQTKSIGEAIAAYVQEGHLEDGLQQARLFAVWNAIVIGQVALRNYTARLSFREGVLNCKMNSSVVRSHLQFQLDVIRAELNARMGGEVVKQIKLT